MSKYIIELDENVKKVVAISLEDAIMWTDEMEVDDLEELNSDYINEHFGDLQDEAYKRGLEEGKKATWGLVADASSAEYQRGFEDGKGAIHKGCEGCKFANVAGTHEPCVRCSNSYPNQWTAKDDKIEVGDEVETKNGTIFVVTKVTADNLVVGLINDGDNCVFSADRVVKTGRHFDIASILEDMRND